MVGAVAVSRLQPTCQFEAVDAGHVQIDDAEVEGVARCGGRAQRVRGACVAVGALRRPRRPEKATVGGECGDSLRCRRRAMARWPGSVRESALRDRPLSRCRPGALRARTRTSSPGRARWVEPKYHQLHELAADGQPQAGATERPRGRGVHLHEHGGTSAPVPRERCRCPCRRHRNGGRHARCSGSRTVTRMTTSPSEVNLTALAPKLSRTCRIRVLSPRRVSGMSGSMSIRSSTPLP